MAKESRWMVDESVIKFNARQPGVTYGKMVLGEVRSVLLRN